ncbi:MAG: hypothetical protein M1814_006890 [Vezdaea aestivalis]|nr:MAG: hypothetical protein M1814_006890 [Vezdaea aestivalis]
MSGYNIHRDFLDHALSSSFMSIMRISGYKNWVSSQIADCGFKSTFSERDDHKYTVFSCPLEDNSAFALDVVDIYEAYSIVLKLHFEVTSDLRSLEEALIYSTYVVDRFDRFTEVRGQEALRGWAMCLFNHGTILLAEFLRLRYLNRERALKILDQAIQYGEHALARAKDRYHHKGQMLCFLATCIRDKMELGDDLSLGRVALNYLEEAFQLEGTDKEETHWVKSQVLYTECLIMKKRRREPSFGQAALAKLSEAIVNGQAAVPEPSSNDWRQGRRHKDLAEMQKSKYFDARDKDEGLYIEMTGNFKAATGAVNNSLSVRLAASLQYGLLHLREKRYEQAHEVFQDAISTLSEVEYTTTPPRDLHQSLRQSSTLAELAASVAIETNKPLFEALRSLELSRCTISRTSTQMEQDVSDLRRTHPALAEQYKNMRYDLNREKIQNKPYHLTQLRQEGLTGRLKNLRDDIQKLDGFENFQQLLTEKDMKSLACQGPVVVINISKIRSDAIIVTVDKILLCKLPNMSYDETKEKIIALDRLASRARRDGVARTRKKQKKLTDVTRGALDALSWLWQVAVREILDRASLTPTNRIWWITSGLATRLPFHAAGDHRQDPSNCTIDRVKSSYISSFEALRHARLRADAVASTRVGDLPYRRTMMLVTVSKYPGPYNDLNTTHEISAIEKLFPRQGSKNDLKEGSNDDQDKGDISNEELFLHLEYPNSLTVLQYLLRYSFVHLACHGFSHKIDPYQSGLLLVEEKETIKMLKIADIETSPHPQDGCSEMVFLAACSTAKIQPDGALADEAIHLGNSFQALGFPHVIAALASADDKAVGQISSTYYKELLRNEMGQKSGSAGHLNAAGALHNATKKLRNDCSRKVDSSDQGKRTEEADDILEWIPFIHIGA